MEGKVTFSAPNISRIFTAAEDQCGGAMVELVFLVPLLLLIIAGLTEMGMVIGQATWVSESAYQTALIGGENQKFLGNKSMEDKYTKLYSLQGSRFKDATPSLSPSYDSDNRTVKFETSGQLRPLLMSEGLGNWLNFHLDLNMGAYYVGSHMAQSPGAVLAGLTVFGNSPTGLFCGCNQTCDNGAPNSIPCSNFLGGSMPAPRQIGGDPAIDDGGNGGDVDWRTIEEIRRSNPRDKVMNQG
jgi:hypothetical protein